MYRKLLYIILYFAFLSAITPANRYILHCDKALKAESMLILKDLVGTKEKTGNNDGPIIEDILRSVNLKKGNPYCAATPYYAYKKACDSLYFSYDSIPLPKSGLAYSHFIYGKTKGKQTEFIPKVGDHIIWGYVNSRSGHEETIVEVYEKFWVKTIGANTSNGKTGSQREGNGIYYRIRNCKKPIGKMIVRGVVGTTPQFINK